MWKPGAPAPGMHADTDKMEDGGAMSVVTFNPNSALSLSQQRARLPVFKVWSSSSSSSISLLGVLTYVIAIIVP